MTTPPPPAAPGAPVSASDEKTWSILSHVGGIVLNWVGPLVVFLIYKDRSAVIRAHSVAALNFQLTLVIAYIAAFIITVVSFGLLGIVFLVPWALGLIFGIMAALAANEGRPYKYPFSIAFIK